MSTITAAPLPVMTTAEASLLDVKVHANVLALIEAYHQTTEKPIPWATLLAAATAVPLADELLTIRVTPGVRVTAVVRDAVTDLLSLRLVQAGPLGLHITPSGSDLVRGWNGEYQKRLAAASELLASVDLIPGR